MKTMRQPSGPAATIIFLLGLWLLAPGSGWSAPDGVASEETTAPVSDAASFARELQFAGALKFYENTEDLLRAGQFERALLRYDFLRGQIAQQPGYRPLVTMVNQRLHFLQGQLRLSSQELAALKPPPPPPSRWQRIKKRLLFWRSQGSG